MVSEREQRNPLYHISPNAPLEVASGAVATGLVGALGAGTYGVLYAPPGRTPEMVLRIGTNMFAFGFCFFGAHEMLVMPYTRAFAPKLISSGHTYQLFPTTLTGAFVGGCAAALFKRRIRSGVVTLSLMSATVQLFVNELGILSGYRPGSNPAPPQAATGAKASAAAVARAHQLEQSASQPSASPDAIASGAETRASHGAPADAPQESRIWSMLKRYSPLQPLSNDDYKKRLIARRAEVDENLIAIEGELALRRHEAEQAQSP